MNVTQKFTGLKYDFDCGWYALVAGRCVQPEIDGTKASAQAALVKARRATGGFDAAPQPDMKCPRCGKNYADCQCWKIRSAFADIDWRNVGQLPAWESLGNEPGYSESLTPFLF